MGMKSDNSGGRYGTPHVGHKGEVSKKVRADNCADAQNNTTSNDAAAVCSPTGQP